MSTHPAAPCVLLVDDDESIRSPVVDHLGLHGYVVDCAEVVDTLCGSPRALTEETS